VGIIVVLVVLAAAAAVLWFSLGGTPPPAPPAQQPAEKKETPASAAPAKPEPPPSPPPPEKPVDARPPEKPPAEKPAPGPPTGLTADQVRKKLDENKAALQGCIDEALRRDPNLRVGKIHIATTIAPSGTVTSARIDKPTVEQSKLGACLRGATKKIAFPSFIGDAFDVDIPIVVTAGE
jgi:outer membrane biosynthesis protein TonB